MSKVRHRIDDFHFLQIDRRAQGKWFYVVSQHRKGHVLASATVLFRDACAARDVVDVINHARHEILTRF